MKIGIIGAMNEEVVELLADMINQKSEEIGNLKFYEGELKGRDVVLVECGIGKVNAAMCATLLIERFKVDQVIFTGVAGGVNPEIEIGDIVISTELIEHDFDCSAFGMDKGVIPRMANSKFKADEEMIALAEKVAVEKFGEARVWKGRILSGDQFVASPEKIEWLREYFVGECTEMEGASVAHVCELLGVPFLIIRAVSDKANSEAHVDFKEFTLLAAKNSKMIIEGMLENGGKR